MDDQTIPPPSHCVIVRKCETNRFQKQLLARAYQQIWPELRRTLADAGDAARLDRQRGDSSKASRLAQGA
jgi:hypothetical protein